MNNNISFFSTLLKKKSILSTKREDDRGVCRDNCMNLPLCLSSEISSVSKKIFFVLNAFPEYSPPVDPLLMVDSKVCQFRFPRNVMLMSGFSPAVFLQSY